MGYRVWYNFDDGTSEDLLHKIFDTEEEAEAAALEGSSNYSTGVETLQLGGHEYPEANIIDWDIDEWDVEEYGDLD